MREGNGRTVSGRTAAVAIALVVVVSGGLGYFLQRTGEASGPHVIFVVIDTLRADYLGFAGDTAARTPRIDRFAKSSTVFTRAYSNSSWTKTSVASYFTGLLPERHGVFAESGGAGILRDSFSTVAEELRALGYRTVAVSANPYVTPRNGLTQGFESFSFIDEVPTNTTESTTATILHAISNADSSAPTFFYFHYLDPHDPYENTEHCRTFLRGVSTENRSVAQGEAGVVSGEAEIQDELEGGRMPVVHDLGEQDLLFLKALYRCEIARVDVGFGRVVDALESAGFLDNALVVLTADHGEEFLEHGRLRHGYQVFEESIRVPLVVRTAARAEAGRRVEAVVSLDQLFSTILLAAGGEIPDGIETKHLPLGSPGSAGAAPVLGLTKFRKQHVAYAILGDHKVIWDFGRDTRELFDLKTDRAEQNPVDPLSSPKGRELVAVLRARKDEIPPQPASGELQPPRALTEAERERLRRLGYID